MEPKFHLGDDLNEFERVLQELAPTPARLDIAQTMFRAGQAAARRPAGRPRLWQATSALLAIVSLTLGALVAMPRQPQVVYVPMEKAAEQRQQTQPTMAAEHNAPGNDNMLSAHPRLVNAQVALPDSRWPTPLSHLRSRGLCLENNWRTRSVTSETSQQTAVPALCLGDWRAMVDDSSRRTRSGVSDAVPQYDWTQLLHIQGL